MAGYSSTPLTKKLGTKKDCRLHVINTPENYLELLSPLPENVSISKKQGNEIDICHLFTSSCDELKSILNRLILKICNDSVIWISWPKEASKVPTDITENVIREIELPLGLVDIKVCSVNEIWPGLKLVIRRENR